MGHKYSTVYNHNTTANFESHTFSKAVLAMYNRLGDDKCQLFKKYPGKHRCKKCFKWMDDHCVIMLNCRMKHRYHFECVTNHLNITGNTFDCNHCEKLVKCIKEDIKAEKILENDILQP